MWSVVYNFYLLVVIYTVDNQSLIFGSEIYYRWDGWWLIDLVVNQFIYWQWDAIDNESLLFGSERYYMWVNILSSNLKIVNNIILQLIKLNGY